MDRRRFSLPTFIVALRLFGFKLAKPGGYFGVTGPMYTYELPRSQRILFVTFPLDSFWKIIVVSCEEVHIMHSPTRLRLSMAKGKSEPLTKRFRRPYSAYLYIKGLLDVQ